jgi:hypothetical protein
MSILLAIALAAPTAGPEIVDVRRIWDAAPHNAFTDLVRFRDRWYCVFREGQDHVSADGALRVIRSADGDTWTSVARMARDGEDLRDAKLTVTPDGRLMLCGAACLDVPLRRRHQSLAWFSSDGTTWSDALPVAEPDFWLWRVTWGPDGAAYGIGYHTTDERRVRLYRAADGTQFETLVPDLGIPGYPNESAIVFEPSGRAVCLLRRDGEPRSGMVGLAQPPYREWAWREVGPQIGGPGLLRLPDGRLIAGVRLVDGQVRTSVCLLDTDRATLSEILPLPSGGDTSYPGLVWHEGLLWVSYYSSHEGKTSIYLARVRLD